MQMPQPVRVRRIIASENVGCEAYSDRSHRQREVYYGTR